MVAYVPGGRLFSIPTIHECKFLSFFHLASSDRFIINSIKPSHMPMGGDMML
jgi:hypothetical protein